MVSAPVTQQFNTIATIASSKFMASNNMNMMDDNTNNENRDNDDDCVEVNEVGEDNKKIKGKRKREKKQTSPVWSVFELLKGVVTEDGIKKAKYTWCNDVKNYASKYGIVNLQRHINRCYRQNTPDVGQMLLGKDKYSLTLKSSKFNKDIFRERKGC